MAGKWRDWGLDRLTRTLVAIKLEAGETCVEAEIRAAGGALMRHEQRFSPLAGGGILVRETVHIPDELADLARVGVVMESVSGLERTEWFGRGPVETYPDRKHGAPLARWSSTVAAEYVPYVRPQENGGHADVRWFELSDGAGRGFRITTDEPRQISATHFRASDLAAASHDVELTPRPETIIHVDTAHRGLGTASCGPDTLDRYLVRPGTYRWSWSIAPLR
jgi:beta-galactosidase